MKRYLLIAGLALALFGWQGEAKAQCVAASGAGGPFPTTGFSCNSEPTIATYGAVALGIVPPASATDLACIIGSASKVGRLQAIRISGTAGTLVNVPITIIKRASLDTGGTPATTTALPVAYSYDSNTATNPAASLTLNAWTAVPTIVDTSGGLLDTGVVVLTATGTLAGNTGLLFDWSGNLFNEKPTLRKATEEICVNLNTTSITSGVVNVVFRWTEGAQ